MRRVRDDLDTQAWPRAAGWLHMQIRDGRERVYIPRVHGLAGLLNLYTKEIDVRRHIKGEL